MKLKDEQQRAVGLLAHADVDWPVELNLSMLSGAICCWAGQGCSSSGCRCGQPSQIMLQSSQMCSGMSARVSMLSYAKLCKSQDFG